MLICDGIEEFHFWLDFRKFLIWEMNREYTTEQIQTLYSRGGLYYELKEDYVRALDCYAKSGDHSKISKILVKNAQLHPGIGHYEEMEQYYRALPDSEVLISPSLMQGMSILCSLCSDYEGSERWIMRFLILWQNANVLMQQPKKPEADWLGWILRCRREKWQAYWKIW